MKQNPYFVNESKALVRTIFPGVTLRIVSGEKGMMALVDLEEGSRIPLHQHPHEQMGIGLEGEFEFRIGDEIRIIRPGDRWFIPGGTPHEVTRALTHAVALDFFSPPREDYLAGDYLAEDYLAEG